MADQVDATLDPTAYLDQATAIGRLKIAGKTHRRATIRLEAAREDLRDAARRGRSAGLAIRAIADAAGVSIGAVQDALKGGE